MSMSINVIILMFVNVLDLLIIFNPHILVSMVINIDVCKREGPFAHFYPHILI